MTASLVSQLEKAGEGSRELDWLVHSSAAAPYWSGCEWNQFGYVDVDGHPPHPDQITVFKDGRSFYDDMPRYTASVTATLELAATLLPRWGMDVGLPARMGEHGGRPWADCWPPVEDGEVRAFRLGGPRPTPRHSNAATPALALCIAILRALPNYQEKNNVG